MKKGFTLVEIMIVVAIIALLAAIAIPNLLRARLTANESAAQGTLRTLSTACETYAAANNGTYPTNATTQLFGVTPKYINWDYCASPYQGYSFTCTGMTTSGYFFTAEPVTPDVTGKQTFHMATGGVLNP